MKIWRDVGPYLMIVCVSPPGWKKCIQVIQYVDLQLSYCIMLHNQTVPLARKWLNAIVSCCDIKCLVLAWKMVHLEFDHHLQLKLWNDELSLEQSSSTVEPDVRGKQPPCDYDQWTGSWLMFDQRRLPFHNKVTTWLPVFTIAAKQCTKMCFLKHSRPKKGSVVTESWFIVSQLCLVWQFEFS